MITQIKIENLVIGGNLEALEYAYREGFHVFYEHLEAPFHLEQTSIGLNKKDIIQNYAFLLSLSGLNLNSYLVGTYRVELEEKKLLIFGRKPWQIQIEFDNIYDFTIQKQDVEYKVVDYINIRSCGSHDFREVKTDDRFVKEIYFYPSKRANSSKKFSLTTHNYETVAKDVIVVSYLNPKEIENEDYSPIYSRLKLLEIMKQIGIKGKKCGLRANGKEIRASIKLEFEKREINQIEQTDRNFYYNRSKNKYLNKIFGYLYGKDR